MMRVPLRVMCQSSSKRSRYPALPVLCGFILILLGIWLWAKRQAADGVVVWQCRKETVEAEVGR